LRQVPGRHLDKLAEHETALLPHLARLGVDDLQRAMHLWRRRADALEDRGPVEHDNEVRFSTTIHGRGELRGSFDNDTTAIVKKAFALADPGDRDKTLAQRQADALVDMAKHFLDNH